MAKKKITRPYIAWVEDDPDDRELIREVYTKLNWLENIVLFTEPEELLEHLSSTTEENELPSIIVSDQHLPKHDSAYILHLVRKDDKLHKIPVCIYSSFMPKNKEQKLKLLGASCCKTKPSTIEDTVVIMKEYIEYAKAGKCLAEQ